jgi:hypothetical protein
MFKAIAVYYQYWYGANYLYYTRILNMPHTTVISPVKTTAAYLLSH